MASGWRSTWSGPAGSFLEECPPKDVTTSVAQLAGCWSQSERSPVPLGHMPLEVGGSSPRWGGACEGQAIDVSLPLFLPPFPSL